MNIIATLKHNNDNIALMELADYNGTILRYKCLEPSKQPFLREMTLKEINIWWQNRSIPNNRTDLGEILADSGCDNSLLYTLKNFALSLSDCYWVCPMGIDIEWDRINLFENIKHSVFMDEDGQKYSNNPNNSLNGTLNKEAVYKDNKWKLIKYSDMPSGEQNVNETFACHIHNLQGFDNYVKYDIKYKNNKPISCICDFFTSKKLEFIPAYNFTASEKQDNALSNYEQYIELCVKYGLDEETVRKFMDYQTLTDFIITNTDRHYSNFGLIRDSETLEILKLAPIFDSGNSMFYKNMYKMNSYDILNIPITAMAGYEEKMLEYVSDRKAVDYDKLPSETDVKEYYINNKISEEYAEIIAHNYNVKLGLLEDFIKGNKVSRYNYKHNNS